MKDFFVPKDLLLFSNSMGMNSDFSVRGFSAGEAEDEGAMTVTVSAASAGIEFVGWSSGSGTATDYSVSLPAGVLPGDLVIVVNGAGGVGDRNMGVVSPSGYVETIELYANDSADANLAVCYKIIGDPVDTSITVRGSGYGTIGAATIVMVFRSVDAVTPLDATTTGATGIDSAHPNAPAITPVTPGALVVAVGCSAVSTGLSLAVNTHPSASDNQIVRIGSSSSSCLVMSCTLTWDGVSAVDPGAWTLTDSNTSCSWAAATLALRPA